MTNESMPYDFFVSYSQQDKAFVDALVHYLEADSIRCWYAPRDITPGKSWPAEITIAIKQSKVMLLVFSESSNQSHEVAKEVTLASTHKRVIVPVRIEDVLPGEEMQFHLGNRHWLDVFGLEMEAAIIRVRENIGQYVPLQEFSHTKSGLKTESGSEEPTKPLQRAQPRAKNTAAKRPFFAGWMVGGLLVVVAVLGIGGYMLIMNSTARNNTPTDPANPTADQAPDSVETTEERIAKAKTLLKIGKRLEAQRLLEQIAVDGSPEAQNLLGDLYYTNAGGGSSLEKAFQWYAKAAAQDNANACYSLACMYYDGQGGTAKNYPEALRWFMRAAGKGDSAAAFALGEMYENGKGTMRNVATAYTWYMRAAEAGDTGAQYQVGVMLVEGSGTPHDREQGLRWLYQAAESGERAAEEYLHHQ